MTSSKPENIRRRTAWLSAAIAAATLLVLIMESAPGNASQEVAVESVVALLAEEAQLDPASEGATPLDTTPLEGLDTSSARLVHADGSAEYWVAVNSTGEICAVGVLGDADNLVSASACVGAERLSDHGLDLRFGTPVGSRVMVLVPDGVDSPANRATIGEAGGEMPARNLILFPPGEGPRELRLDGPEGGELLIVAESEDR